MSSPLVGGLVDRLGARRMVLLGGCLLTIGLVGSAMATALWQMVFLYGVVMTLGAGCIGMVVFVPLVSRLFVERRGLAISILQSANGFGRAVSAPVAQLLIDGAGWRGAYWMQAGAMAVLVVPLAAMFRRAESALPPPVVPPAGGAPAAERARDWTLAAAMRTRHFWLLSLVYMLTSIGSFLVSLHQIAFAVGQGFDPLYAAFVLGTGALLALPGVIVTGSISDVIGREKAAILTYLISIVGVAAALGIHSARPARDAVDSCVLLRHHLGRARPGHHGEDRRPVRRARGSAPSLASSPSGRGSAPGSAPGGRGCCST